MESDQACSSDVAPWWSHHSIIEEAEPLDATADDAAASCLSDIAKQTADHILAYRNNLLNLLGAENPARQDSAVHTSQHTGDANSSSLHQLMKWDGVLLPLLTQLRKCMARAWDERAAEEAQKAADDPTPAPAAVIGRGGTKATLYPHFDAVQARRLRVLQQQIYLAFLKAVLQGLADGARGAVATNDKASNAARAEEGNSTDAQDDKATETTNTALADRVLSALLDNLLTHILSCATAGSTKSLPHIEDGEAAKPRRGLGRRAPAATGTHTGDWLSGMLPLYLRAAHQQHAHAHGGVAEQDGTVSAPAPAARIPSPALCLVSYIGAFVQGAGLQLSPSEQEAYLPCFTHKVHSEFRGELQRLVQASVAHTECTATSLARSDPAAIATTAAHIRYASDVVKTIVDTQLYCNENATEVDDDDCTMIYAALPRPPAPCARSQLSEMPTEVDYSVAPLLTLTSYKVCEGLLRPLSHWWVACQNMVRHAGIFTALAVPSVDKDGKVGREQQQQQQQNDGPTNGNDTNLLAGVEEAWLGLRKQVMTLALVFSNYSETTLFIVPFMNLLTDIFFVSELAPPKQTPPPSEAWRCCVRELHRITHATHDGSHTLVAHAASGARRHLRVHHRHVRDCTFATACFSRVMECLSDASIGAHVPAAAAAAAAGTDHQPHSTEPHNLMPLAFATLQQPLSVMQEHVFRVLLAVNSVTMDMRVDAVVRIKSVPGEHGTPADVPGAHPTMQPSQWPASGAATGSMCFKALTEEYLSAVQLVELYFPHHYRVFLALEEAMQYVLDRSQELASGSTVAEETGDGDKIASVWAAPFSLTPATLARFIGAVLDEACVARMRNTSDEVAMSELFMFFAAVFRTLPSTVLPRLRSALETFLGEGGCSLIEYLRYHIVAQQHHGLAAFFLPPLRAMALDYTTAEDADVSLALTAKYPCSGAIAYLWEQPRLYFWQAEDTPVTAAAWHAQAAAQRYLCELVAPVSATATTLSTPFLDIVQSAAAVASERCAALLEKTKTAPGLLWTRGLAMDVMTSLFFGVCRWCALQFSASSSSSMAMATAMATATAPLSAEAATMLIRYLCSPRAASVALSSANSAANSFLVSLRDRSEAQLESNSRVAAAEAKDIVVGKEYVEATNSPSNLSPPPTQQLPRSSSRQWLSWFWACGYDQVGTSVRVQTAAKRLLREFSAHCGSYAPTKTLLGIRAGVEQMKEGGAPDGEGAVHDLREAVRGDLDALLQQQQQQEEEEQQSLREKREDEKTAAVASISNLQEVAMTTATATTIAAAAGAVLQPATLREYLDHIHEALVQRARISPIDGAISAATLGHLLHVLSDAQLPITMTVQERQRMCQRFFFTLANSLTECTRTEALSCLCCMRCVLHDIVLPYKKSFLIEASAARAFHCCLPDMEADAFRMVQHAFGDVVMAVQKMALRNSILDEWKIVLVLQHLGDTISLVRSVAEKLRGTVKKITSRRRGVAIDAMTQQLAIVEKSASCTKRGAADDIYRLFTLHPMPSPSPSTATSTKALPAAATTAPLAAAAPVERSSSGRRNHSNHRERERRNEKDRKRSFDDGGRRGGGGGDDGGRRGGGGGDDGGRRGGGGGGGDDGGRRGGGGGGETSLKMPRRNDSKPHRSNFKRPRR
ncbi:hypothetical protein JKF63_04680 [Porcisia hertigi]|uniref:Uncharacterized protein n=1 Tax=Porcisia hertigi TaxID=2761500 RepID=A0A836ICZ6_9TRYP|nr:hypothetical protein JKF63_04680 [Porcisia hertigi]